MEASMERMERMPTMKMKHMGGSVGCQEAMDAGYAARWGTGPESVHRKAKARAARAKEEATAKLKAKARGRRQDAGRAEKIIIRINVQKEAGAKEARKEAAKGGKETEAKDV